MLCVGVTCVTGVHCTGVTAVRYGRKPTDTSAQQWLRWATVWPHNRHGPKIGDCAAFWEAECGLGRGPPPYQVASF